MHFTNPVSLSFNKHFTNQVQLSITPDQLVYIFFPTDISTFALIDKLNIAYIKMSIFDFQIRTILQLLIKIFVIQKPFNVLINSKHRALIC